MKELLNLSPIDGRYQEKTKELNNYFSEYALMKYRIEVEIKWLIYILKENIVEGKMTPDDENSLSEMIEKWNIQEAEKVKKIEEITKHDVKAVEYYLREKLEELSRKDLIPYLHFALTSEDINNVSYHLMIKDAIEKVYFPNLQKLIDKLEDLSHTYKKTAMLGHTHGQVATPTTVGKEWKVFAYRMESIQKLLKTIKLKSKFSGTVGNYNAHVVSCPEVDWREEAKNFIESLNLEYNPIATQIESHDILCLLLSHIKILNNIIKDLDSDMWLYISMGYFKEKKKKDEVGSSIMPHKVNPINYENSMANVEIANSIIDSLVNNLSISRMQRDLSDSSKLRNLGVIFAHSLISIKETMAGLEKIEVNEKYLNEELENHYEVLSEAIQTVLRKNRVENAYELLKEKSRGKQLTKEDIKNIIDSLEIDKKEKERLRNLTPKTYIGLAEKIVEEKG